MVVDLKNRSVQPAISTSGFLLLLISLCGARPDVAVAQPAAWYPAVSDQQGQEGKWGFVDPEGSFVIEPEFDLAGRFIRGLAPVQKGERWGYIKPDGEYHLEPQYLMADEFAEGLAAVITDGQILAYIAEDGSQIISTSYPWGERFSRGLAVVKQGENYGLINRDGETIVEPKYAYLGRNSGGRVAAKRFEGTWTYLDSAGQELDMKFEYAGTFFGRFAWVQSEGRFGLIDRGGEFVLTAQYDWAMHPGANLGLVRSGVQVALMNLRALGADPQPVPDCLRAGPRRRDRPQISYGYADLRGTYVLESLDAKGPPVLAAGPSSHVPVELISNREPALVYRPSKWQYERAKRAGDINALLTASNRCPVDASDFCSLDRFMEYRLIFVFGNNPPEVRRCIPTIDNPVKVNFP